MGRPFKQKPERVETFGDWLLTERLKLGLGQYQFNKLVGGGFNASQYETGERKAPARKTVRNIERVLGVIPERFKIAWGD